MTGTAEKLKYLEWGFWLGGAVFVVLLAFVGLLISQADVPSAEYEWIPIASAVVAAVGLLVCVGSRVMRGVVIERALRAAFAQYQASQPNALPNYGQLAMLAGLPEGRAWEAREWLGKHIS